jgi:dTDP-4-amino-4,6-dideoxygalactose transaminase
MQLAIHGGTPVTTARLGHPWPIWGDEERQLLSEVLESGRWSRTNYREGGPARVGQFEAAFAQFQDAKYGLAVTNGTTALECAYRCVGVEAGDEVIVPALTFVATATAVLQLGAVPVFVDVDPNTYTINPGAVEAAITPRTRAIACVDYGGMPCDYDALIALRRRTGIPVVADCAHAHGSRWRGTGVGALTEVGTFSFQIAKPLTCGEGGMVLTNDRELWERAYAYHHIGRRWGQPDDEYGVRSSNLRMTEWQAAVGLAQLSRLDAQVATREANARLLMAGLQQLQAADVGVAPLECDVRVTRWGIYIWNFRFLPAFWDGVSRDRFVAALQAEGIRCGAGARKPLYRHSLFQQSELTFGSRAGATTADYSHAFCPEVERICATESVALRHVLFLGPPSDMQVILTAIEKLWTHRHTLA